MGQTEQPLKKRMYQHRRAAGEGISSAVYNHLHDHTHEFSNDNVEILCREKNWFERGVQEAIYISALQPSLNKLGGARFKLSSAWNESIEAVARSHVTRVPTIHSQHPIEGDETSSRI